MNKSILLFVGMGLLVCIGLFVSFFVLPKLDEGSGTYGNEKVSLSLPIQERDLRFNSYGVNGFCIDRRGSLDFEVSDDTSVVASMDGSVVRVSDGVVRVEVSSGVYVDYSVLDGIKVREDEYVTRGDVLGYATNNVVHLFVVNYMDRLYECPYRYMDNEARGVVDSSMDRAENSSGVCGCTTIKY